MKIKWTLLHGHSYQNYSVAWHYFPKQFSKARQRLFWKIFILQSGIRNGVQIPNQSNINGVHSWELPEVSISVHIQTYIQGKIKLFLCLKAHTKSHSEIVRLLMIQGFYLIVTEPQPFSFTAMKGETCAYYLCTFSVGYFQSLSDRSCWGSRNHRSFCRVISHRPEEYVLWELSGDTA